MNGVAMHIRDSATIVRSLFLDRSGRRAIKVGLGESLANA